VSEVTIQLSRKHADALLPLGPISPAHPCRLCGGPGPAHFCRPLVVAQSELERQLRQQLSPEDSE
jgi:hypothetical protein